MRRITYMLSTAALLVTGLLHAEDEEKDRKRAERRLQNVEARAKSLPKAGPEPTSFLEAETRRLLERRRNFALTTYESDRLLEAIDDLLDAREDLHASVREGSDKDKRNNKPEGAAKRLERAYFRVQQGEYFAKLSGDKRAMDYLPIARQLYQRARAAYDAQEYGRANRLASASGELVDVLENLAQAAVRRPEPPVLK